LLTVEQAAHYLGLPADAVSGLIAKGALPVVRIAGSTLIDKHDVRRLILRSKASARPRDAAARTQSSRQSGARLTPLPLSESPAERETR